MKLTPALRARVYEISLAVCAILVAKGLLTGDEAALWLVLVAAVLGLARVNVNPA